MSWVVKRSNGRYQARWRQPDGQWRSRTFDRKVDATRFLTDIDADMNRGAYRDPKAADIVLGDYAAQWLATKVHRDSSHTHTETNLRRHILPRFADRKIGTIRPSEVQAWVKWLSTGDDEAGRQKLAPTTVEGIYRLLAEILRAAVADQIIPSSPCQRITLPRKDGGKVVPLSVDQVAELRDGMPDEYQIAVTVAAGVGLRSGEVLGLTVDRVDFLRRTIKIDRQLITPAAGLPHFGPPKTPSSNRTVPMPKMAADGIAAHLAAHGEGTDRLIVHHDAAPVRRQRLQRPWEKARKAVDLEHVVFHDLRHHCASLLIASGCSVKAVQDQLGHASASETLDTYSHLWPSDDDRIRSAVDEAWGSAPLSRPIRAL